MTTSPRLLFVYNAADGIAAALFDAGHKLLSPATYRCSLCAVTYGAVSMRREWREWLRGLSVDPEFYHRDGFARDYPGITAALPLILLDRNGMVETLLDAPTLDRQHDLPMLIATLEAQLKEKAPDALKAPGAI